MLPIETTEMHPIVTIRYQNRDVPIQTWSAADYIHTQIESTHQFFEIPTLEFIRNRSLTGRYIDIGANIGNHSVYFALFCPSRAIHSIEGNPAILPILCNNLNTQSHPKTPYFVHPYFISQTRNLFFNQHADSNIGCSHVSQQKLSDRSTSATTIRLDEISEGLSKIDLIKIDVEGHELSVLESGIKTIRKHRPEICVESFYPARFEVHTFLTNQGYRLLGELSHSNLYYVPDTPLLYWIVRILPKSIHTRVVWRLRKLLPFLPQ